MLAEINEIYLPIVLLSGFHVQFYWLNINAGYDGDVYLTIVLNGFIHTVMYTYYFVSMHTKDIWWKKYLTLMQVCPCRVFVVHVWVLCAGHERKTITVVPL